jgi:hypothetical protein
VTDWAFAQENPGDELCQIHHFAIKHMGTEFVIRVREYVTPPDPGMKFFAQADKQTNQRTAPVTPSGWGPTLLFALAECMKAIKRFPYEAD